MADGASHWYRGFVSPNDISGKLKFFVSPDNRPDRSYGQALGHKGITAHSVYAKDIQVIYQLAKKHQLNITSIQTNEYKEQAFVINGPDGSVWQVIQKKQAKNQPKKTLEFVKTGQ
jgi:hypothetical protein